LSAPQERRAKESGQSPSLARSPRGSNPRLAGEDARLCCGAERYRKEVAGLLRVRAQRDHVLIRTARKAPRNCAFPTCRTPPIQE